MPMTAQAHARVRRHRLPRLGGAAGPADGRGRRPRGARRGLPGAGSGSPSPGAPTPACTRSGRSPASTSTAARRRARRRGAEHGASRTMSPSLAAEEAPPDFHARFSARSRATATASRDGASARPSRSGARCWWPRPLDLDALAASAELLLGRARLPRVHADRDAARGLRPRSSGRRRWHDRGDAPRLQITADCSCGTWCGRSSARCSSGPRSEFARLLEGRAAGRGGLDRAAVGPLPRARRATERRCVRSRRRVRFPVVLFDLDGTLIDSGPIILASMRHATQTVLGRESPTRS